VLDAAILSTVSQQSPNCKCITFDILFTMNVMLAVTVQEIVVHVPVAQLPDIVDKSNPMTTFLSAYARCCNISQTQLLITKCHQQ
jgi:hypothetical protein